MILNVIDGRRKKLLPLLKELREEFYLVGGTALALQIGHRKSVDFDFFAYDNFDVKTLQARLRRIFKSHQFSTIQFESGTLSIFIDEKVKLSFFYVEGDVVLPMVETEWFRICNELEIGAMKIAALLRAAFRDYVDLFFLLKKYKVEEVFEICKEKYPEFEKSVYLKALLSYDDIEITPIKYMSGKEKKPEEIFSFIEKETKLFLAKNNRGKYRYG